MMPMIGNAAASSPQRALGPAAMPAESLEQRIVAARQFQFVPGGPVAMEIAVHERRAVEAATHGLVDSQSLTPHPERGVAPYGPSRRRGSREFVDPIGVQYEQDASLRNELAWEQGVQRQAMTLVEQERGLAENAVREFREIGTEAIWHESERARARVARELEQVRELEREVQVARQGQLRGEGRLRLVEQAAQAELDSHRQQLQEVSAAQGHALGHMTAEMRHELAYAQEQREHQQIMAAQAQAMSSHAHRESEVMHPAHLESQQNILYLQNEIRQRDAQVGQLTHMMNDMMWRRSANAGSGLAAMQARDGETSSAVSATSPALGSASVHRMFPGLLGRATGEHSPSQRPSSESNSPGGSSLGERSEVGRSSRAQSRASATGSGSMGGSLPVGRALPVAEVKTTTKEAATIKLMGLPRALGFRSWKMAVRNEVAGASGDPQAAFQWILKVEKTGANIEDFADSESFPTLDAKLAAAICRIAQGDLSHRINLVMDLKARAGTMMTGRQMLYLV